MKASRTFRKLKKRKTGRNKTHMFIVLIVSLIGIAVIVQGTGLSPFSAFETTDDWSGSVSIAGFIEDGKVYDDNSDFASTPTWTDTSLISNFDGRLKLRSVDDVINPSMPKPDANYMNLVGYPTAKPKITWEIQDNIQHIDVDGNWLSAGTPSVIAQENGLLVETYYYTFSVTLQITATSNEYAAHDYYELAFNQRYIYTRWFWEVAPLEGIYLLPEIQLESTNDSVISMGSDLATYDSTKWKFYDLEGRLTTTADVMADLDIGTSYNRDFFLAGGDSSAGLNLYDRVDDNTNQFTVGFVKVGNPFKYNPTGWNDLYHTGQDATSVYEVLLAIPLRMSVIIVYDMPYTGQDTFNYGNETSSGGDDQWFNDIESGLRDLNIQAGGGVPFIPPEMLYPVLIIGFFIGAIIIRRF